MTPPSPLSPPPAAACARTLTLHLNNTEEIPVWTGLATSNPPAVVTPALSPPHQTVVYSPLQQCPVSLALSLPDSLRSAALRYKRSLSVSLTQEPDSLIH